MKTFLAFLMLVALGLPAHAEPESLRIRVIDRGQGIPSELHEKIFEVFHSGKRSSEPGHSNGVGLAIVKKVAETWGGRAWVESETGRGACFHVSLPRS